MPNFLTPLKLEYINGKAWKIDEAFVYAINGYRVMVPVGFITDFASVPRFFWRILPPTGSYGKAAVIHDYLYQYPAINAYQNNELFRTKVFSRKDCDRVFLEAMEVLAVAAWKRKVMYWGVRAGGWKPWNRYRKEQLETARAGK